MDNNNKKFIRAMGIFFGIVLLLTFFSKTIYNFNLPTVTVTLPTGGKLVDIVEGSAPITYADSHNIYAKMDGKVKNIFIIGGQEVKKGQPLMELEPDMEQIEQLTLDIEKKRRDIELLTIKLDNVQSELKKPGYESDIRIAEKVLADKKALFDIGAVSRSEVDEAEDRLETAHMQYEQYIQQYIQSEKENKSDLSFQRSNAQSELAMLRKKLARAENGGILAETDGIVTAANVERGAYIVRNDILFQVAELSNEWKIEFVIDEEKLDLFDAQSTVEVTIKGVSGILTGEIAAITPYESENQEKRKVVVIIRNSNQTLAGKIGDIKIKTERGPYTSIIPNIALRKDAKGYYILVLREENNILGKIFTVHKISVDLLDTDASLSAIQGLTIAEPVITASTAPIDDGNRVKYSKAGDEK